MITSTTPRRASRVSLRSSLRNSTIGRVAGLRSREMQLDEGSDEDNSDSASMSSSSDGTQGGGAPSARRQSRHTNGLTKSMVRLNKSGNKAVQWSKFTIIGVLVVIATIIIAWTYVMLEAEDLEDFELGFENLALEMLHRVSVKAANVQTTFHSLASGVSGYATQRAMAAERTSEWPFVTMPNWQVRALNTFQLTNAPLLGFSPLVNMENLTSWQFYSRNQASLWMEEALQYQQQLFQLVRNGLGYDSQMDVFQEIVSLPNFSGSGFGITDYVYNLGANGEKVPVVYTDNTDPVVPVWQLAPAPLQNASLVNYNLLNHTVIAHALEQVLKTRQPALTAAFEDVDQFWKGSAFGALASSGIDLSTQTTQPTSLFLTPILDVSSDPNSTLVGVLLGAVPWNTHMERALANEAIRGLHVVLEWTPAQACAGLTSPPPTPTQIQDVFTYRVDGNDATFLGWGDLHEEKYDHMVQTLDFVVPVVRSGVQPNLTCAYGHYTWSVYPSQELHDTNYNPSNALSWFYAFSVVGVFCIATVIFLSYDYLVQLRQKAVLDTAMRSNAIITNLFPSNVRERIMIEAEEQAEAEYQQKKLDRKRRRNLRRMRKKDRHKALEKEREEAEAADKPNSTILPYGLVPKHQLKDFLSESKEQHRDKDSNDDDEDDEFDEEGMDNTNSKPIADLFPAATVLFADIVGFTAWSSVREPAQVFQLLETLYHHFDEIANRRRVFKVETIGDCYVAVTGLPDPRPDHAVVMSRFARDILNKSRSLCQRLEVILGPDTGDLCLRIGLHSGAVTAGVLRGEKSRFQLFGDTVNTAARMESNGTANKIHMSQDTAKLLQAAGKKWTKKRGDLVEAKGKGKMQTYWLATGRANNQRLSVSQHYMTDSTTQGSEASSLKSRRNLSMPLGAASSRFSHAGGLVKTVSARFSNFHDMTLGSRVDSLTLLPTGSGEGDDPRRQSTDGAPGDGRKSNVKGLVTSKKTTRLVRWNAEVLSRLLKQIVARRNAVKALGRSEHGRGSPSCYHGVKDPGSSNGSTAETKPDDSFQIDTSDDSAASQEEAKGQVLEEVQEIIHLPIFDAEAARNQDDPYNIQLDEVVKNQLLAFVTEVASMYHYNPFHNFEHASHVTMSVVKLLSRIVAPDAVVDLPSTGDTTQLVKSLHDHTYGITSDPLTQFAVVLSALIHDMDHPGVPNATLVKEGAPLAAQYDNKSVAEQNSVDLAWEIIMSEDYKELRSTICATKSEKKRFRQLVVNAVMATDIADKELKVLRNQRWDKAFKLGDEANHVDENRNDEVNRKATIVIEHLIQASDIAHTMQHWHIYRKWNERFFEEMYTAYLEGRAETDPTTFWYKGEIGFFDFYIIPLAKKLKECGVFGVSSDEYLNYAETNRKEWEVKGKEVVQEYIDKYGKKKDQDEKIAKLAAKMDKPAKEGAPSN